MDFVIDGTRQVLIGDLPDPRSRHAVANVLELEPDEELEPGTTMQWRTPSGEKALLAVVRLETGAMMRATVRARIGSRTHDVIDVVYSAGARVELVAQGSALMLSFAQGEDQHRVMIVWDPARRRLLAVAV